MFYYILGPNLGLPLYGDVPVKIYPVRFTSKEFMSSFLFPLLKGFLLWNMYMGRVYQKGHIVFKFKD